MHYTIIISRNGVPHEEWTANTGNAHAAVEACRFTRQHTREHQTGDTYDAVPTPDIIDENALLFAFVCAAQHMPALLGDDSDDPEEQDGLPVWLGADAEPLTFGGVLCHV